ncbi:DUF6894 family protein [Tardiphaga sp. 604_B6_N1_1]|uniref:DUF6894 family protein n=1 Tax=unclassified Tardiphaga TaxID=2631404 RepID=UPI003F283EDC
MPKYYFDVQGQGVPEFDEGEQFDNDQAAWHEATLVAGELFKDVDGDLTPGQSWKLEVLDERRRPLYVISVTSEKLG